MKRFICIVMLFVCLFPLSGCITVEINIPEESTMSSAVVTDVAEDAIIGQWKRDNAEDYLLIYPNGEIVKVDINAMGEYITSVMVHEDGSYTTSCKWYKNDDGEYVYVYTYMNGKEWERELIIEGDTLRYDDDIYEWYRLSPSEELSTDEIYYSTFDEENMDYIIHPLSELIK